MKYFSIVIVFLGAVTCSAAKNDSAPKTVKEAPKAAPVKASKKITVKAPANDWRSSFEEAKNLIVPNQKYILRFEDEDLGMKSNVSGHGPVSLTFTPADVQQFQDSMQTVFQYAQDVKKDCNTTSSRTFFDALSRYAQSLSSFHKKALPLVGDISENNNVMVLIVNRTTLKDTAVLTSRYLQYKKQRFKESMSKFLNADTQLVSSFATIAKVLKSELSEEDWNRAYGLREQSLELVSQWPRKLIFDATNELADSHEKVCIVNFTPTPAPVVVPIAGKTEKPVTPAE